MKMSIIHKEFVVKDKVWMEYSLEFLCLGNFKEASRRIVDAMSYFISPRLSWDLAGNLPSLLSLIRGHQSNKLHFKIVRR